MYVIMAYDVNEKRVAKILKIGRKYLTWMQNSLLEGEITKSKFERLKDEIKRKINPKEDSVIFYILPTEKYLKKEFIGEKREISNLI